MDFYLTDVFGQQKYSGNQLATFLHCGALSSWEMQKIAREINFSETTFVLSEQPTDAGYNVRIFTPNEEIEFAGHPTLGTAFIIQQHLIGKPVERVVLNLKVGQVPVHFPLGTEDANLWMRQVEPTFGAALDAVSLAQVLGLEPTDLDTSWPIAQVSTGLPHIVVPLKSMAALKRASLVREHYLAFISRSWAKSVLVFSPEAYTAEHAFAVRVFADYYGVPEDPATGSGNGCLAAYLVKQKYFGSASINLRVGQGYEMGRPSELALRAEEAAGGIIRVEVGGKVIPIAKGQWL
jgi:trans-2,3-dihydro-3-hydroxyanthranilate isomerase